MTDRTISVALSDEVAAAISEIERSDGISQSELLAVGADLIAHLSPAARRSVIALASGSEEERIYAFKSIGRNAMMTRERVVTARNTRK